MITYCEENDISAMDGVRIPYERTAALLKWHSVGEVLISGVYNAGDIQNSDGLKQAKSLAEKF